jgi:hypothetical protein
MADDPYFLALDQSDMKVEWKAPVQESYDDIDVSELLQLNEDVKTGAKASEKGKKSDKEEKKTEKPAKSEE